MVLLGREGANLEDRVDIHTDDGKLCTSIGERAGNVCSSRLHAEQKMNWRLVQYIKVLQYLAQPILSTVE